MIESLIGAQNTLRGFTNLSSPTALIEIPVDPIIDLLVNSIVIPNNISFTYQVVEGFDQPLGKFPNTLGNVALIDCHSVGPRLQGIL